MKNKMNAGWNIVFLTLFMHASAQKAKECPRPSKHQFTKLDAKYMRQKYSHGEKVYYDCAVGFTPVRGSRSVQCDNGQWTQLTLKCEKKSCGNAGDLINGEFRYEETTVLGDKVYAVCNSGYTLKGPKYLVCKSSGWTGKFPSCEEITCEKPKAQLQHKFTMITGLKPSYKHGNSLSFSCDETHRLNGSSTVTCGLNGKWTPTLPKCRLIRCPELKIANSKLSSKHNRVKTVVNVRCHKGYQQKGPSSVVCLNTGMWSAIPQCVSESTPEITCSSPAVANSVKNKDAAVHQVGESVTFNCSQGFQLNGSQQVTCGPDGQWQPQLPQCLPSNDKEGGCGVPALIQEANAHLADSYITMTSFASGDQVRYMCDIGYTYAGGSRYRKCVSGKWTPLLLRCERKSCGSAGEIDNGQFVYTGVDFGDTATAVCNDGYQLVGQGTRTCMNGGWDGREPVCEVVQCDEPQQVTNAVPTGTPDQSYSYRSVISYRCPVGMLIGKREIWCTKDGTWSAPPPVCEEITCPYPSVANALWIQRSKPFQYRDIVSFVCHRGYELVGADTVACSINGQWIPKLPTCRRARIVPRY